METPGERVFEARESICPFCGVGCGLSYDPKSGKATGWRAPVNTRGELCPKGVAAFDVVDHPDRLTAPLVRDGDGLREATWEEAFERIETAFGEIRDRDGPDALFFFASSNCTNEENYVFQKLARLLGTNNVDNCARLCHSSTVAAMQERFGAGAMTNSLVDLTEADAYFVVGANPAENHPIIFQSYLAPAIRDGTTLIHVDPRENATTKLAAHHLPVRPGYDIPLLNAMAKVLVEEGLTDDAFLEERVSGVDAFVAALDGVDVDANAELAGVDPGELRAAARAYASVERAAIFTGMGTSQHHCGTDNVHALLNLALLTGNVGKRGSGVNPLRGQNNVQGAGDVGALPNVLPGYAPVTDVDARERLAREWGVEPPAVPGLTEVEATHAFGGGVRGAFVFGENPVVTEPNANRVAEKFDSLDFLAVHDLFLTETAAFADVVLPGSAWAERGGTVTNTDRQVQRMRPNADPPGDAREDLAVLCELGRRLTGLDAQFDYDSPEQVFEEIARVTPQYAGMSYAGLGTGSQRWPFPEGATEGVDVLHRERFASGDRCAALRVVEHVDPADAVDDDHLVLTTGRVLQHFNSGALTRRSGLLTRLRSEDALQIHPDDAVERGIDDGVRVRVANDRGSVTVVADVTPAVRRGTVFATFHYAEPLANALTGDALDPVSKIPEYKHSAVRVTVENAESE
ncbi:formate dehydrogenase subunit alpha [Halogeometricum limi]|uniref:Formate dehydrogenase major subunit n=1 Tax=Halogeometricum limi TaxID=555875 RepID=A0A1I6I953_9EURY|nr:formate dehydrogenase subunit alpha [Halogeometricum limi]SFR63262.1 formate dehydrogenase major subunit [Halogeometricum limi]